MQRRRAGNAFYLCYLLLAILFGGIFAAATDSLSYLPTLAEGALTTVEITLLAAVLGVVMAFVSGLMRLYAPLPLKWIAVAYIEVFRGTSALVQLFWLYFVLPQFGLELSAFWAAVLGLGLHVGGYGAEIVRGTVAAVPRAQWEASTALNLPTGHALRRIILPQALAAMIPPWGNLAIELLKLTSLVSLITLADLTYKAQQINLATFRTIEVFTLMLVAYLILSLLLTLAIRWLDRRLALRFGRLA